MKYLLLLLICAHLFASDVDELIAKITASKSVEKSALSSAKNPFESPAVKKETNKKDDNTTKPLAPPEPTFTLKAIFEKTALINDKWLKQGDKLEGYEVFQINAFNVVLRNQNKQKTLYLFKGRK